MSTVGQRERTTQDRVVKLLREKLGYKHLGNWAVRPDNSNIEEVDLRPFLKRQGYSETLIGKALHELKNRKKNLALLSVCAAGGLGSVMVLEAKD